MVAASVAQQRFQMLLVGAFALLVFVLAVVGTYGVTAYGVSDRNDARTSARGGAGPHQREPGVRVGAAGLLAHGRPTPCNPRYKRRARSPLATTSSDPPMSAATAIQSVAQPPVASTRNTAFTSSDATTFCFTIPSVRRE